MRKLYKKSDLGTVQFNSNAKKPNKKKHDTIHNSVFARTFVEYYKDRGVGTGIA